ncbi:MAG TPA: ABC transporter ATP-binding protein, partial [Agrobacterium sp.]|nr:ABC transporter ATP-binding protein [Agrobacterium sp.]
MTKHETLLAVKDLSIDFHLRTHVLHAVRNVSFNLERGKTLALVGESGSGKSVTARALMRIIDKPGQMTGGQIVLDGPKGPVDIAKFAASSREVLAIRGGRIGLIFQEPMSS